MTHPARLFSAALVLAAACAPAHATPVAVPPPPTGTFIDFQSAPSGTIPSGTHVQTAFGSQGVLFSSLDHGVRTDAGPLISSEPLPGYDLSFGNGLWNVHRDQVFAPGDDWDTAIGDVLRITFINGASAIDMLVTGDNLPVVRAYNLKGELIVGLKPVPIGGRYHVATAPVAYLDISAGYDWPDKRIRVDNLQFTSLSYTGGGIVGGIAAGSYNARKGVTWASSGSGVVLGNFGAAAAVPEPASWAMMIAGFGVVGTAMRRRRRVAVALG